MAMGIENLNQLLVLNKVLSVVDETMGTIFTLLNAYLECLTSVDTLNKTINGEIYTATLKYLNNIFSLEVKYTKTFNTPIITPVIKLAYNVTTDQRAVIFL